MDTVYSLEVWVADGERWRWSAIGAYPTLDMAVAVGEGLLSVKPYRVRRVTDVGDGFHDFLAEEVFANALTSRMRLLREKFGHEGRGCAHRMTAGHGASTAPWPAHIRYTPDYMEG